MCRVVLLVMILVVGLNAQRDKKFFRKDYKYFEVTQSFYKVHTIHRNWNDAKSMCETEGARLFYPQDEAEANTILAYWNETQPFYSVFIGISSPIARGVFETIDNNPISDVYDKWAPGEPNSDGSENCVELKRDGGLNDVGCDKNFAFICKKTLSSLQWNSPCNIPDTGYTFGEATGKCYKFHLRQKTWTDAYVVCNAEQSYLAVIDSQVEADYLKEFTAQAAKDKIKDDFTGGAVLLGFHNRNGNGWATIKDAQNEKKFFRNDYQYVEETQSFYKFHTTAKHWNAAKSTCEMEGAKLFYPDNEKEANAVIAFWSKTQPFEAIAIGISAPIVSGVFVNVDYNSILDGYINWRTGEPNNANAENCVQMYKAGYMNDISCAIPQTFICKKTLSSLRWNPLCNLPREDYTYSDTTGKCYKFHSRPRTWRDAYIYCSAEQSYLAVINNQEEADYLKGITTQASSSKMKRNNEAAVVLLGFYIRDHSGWMTVKGVDLENSGYNKWEMDIPDEDRELCGAMNRNGSLNYVNCTTKAPFICERDVATRTTPTIVLSDNIY